MALDTALLASIAWDFIQENAREVLTLAWEGEGPGHSGAHYIIEWNGYYFLSSSDIESEGPYESIDDVLELECFRIGGTPNPSLDSKVLPLPKLLRVARGLVASGETIEVNGERFELRG